MPESGADNNLLSAQIASLNESQRLAVTTTQGPLLVIAGAGSGKTRVLTLRIAYLLSQGVKPYRVLALTFTNKAAMEMKRRIAEIVGEETASMVHAGTFHSIFLRILRREVNSLEGYAPDFTIYDTDRTRRMLTRVIKDLEIDEAVYTPRRMMSCISKAKNGLFSAQQYRNSPQILERDERVNMPHRARIYQEYELYMQRANAMDFDDLLLRMHQLLVTNPDILRKYQQAYQYLLVDEFQDTNSAQNAILHLLAGSHQNLCVVGDDSQSIYAFRGAKVENILRFTQRYKNAQVIKLELNYRSTPSIVNSANRLIAHNQNRLEKECRAEGVAGERVQIRRFPTTDAEASFVARDVKDVALMTGLNYGHFAVLYRNNSMSRALEFMFKAERIPVQIYGGQSMFARKEIQDLLAYFSLVCNPNDDDAFLRVINTPRRGLGAKSMQALLDGAKENGESLWTRLAGLERFPSVFSSKACAAVRNFRDMIRLWQSEVDTVSALDLARTIYVDSGLRKLLNDEALEDDDKEGVGRDGNVQELLHNLEKNSAAYIEQGNDGHYTLRMFLDEVSLLSDQDRQGKEENEGGTLPKVTLSTIHSSKGLEFDYVYVVGLEEGVFPSRQAIDSGAIEEERRLCYVAMTRAAKRLVMTYSEQRFFQGRRERNDPSRFLREIEPEYLMQADQDVTNPDYIPQFRDRAGDASLNFQVGDRVRHRTFGRGEVRQIMGEDSDLRVKVAFEESGLRTLILKFARLEHENA